MNKEQIKEIYKEVVNKNKEYSLLRKTRIATEQNIFNKLVGEFQCCKKCGRKDNLSLDHIVPTAILQMFGMDTETEMVEGNYQILCRPCNVYKGYRLDFSLPQTKIILLNLLEKI